MTGAVIDEDDDETLNLRIQCQEPDALVRPLELYGPIASGYLKKRYGHPCPANAQVTSQCRPAFELAGVEQRLVMAGQFQAVRTFFAGWLWFRFFGHMRRPRVQDDDRRLT